MLEENSDHSEKIFNLQLTIQKLEEELQLYRNGTSVTELLELIHEKDIEIETLTLQNEEKTNKLKKLAKTSGEVLIKYENIQIELQKKQDLLYETERHIYSLQDTLMKREEYIEMEIKVKQIQMQKQLEEKDSLIGELELKLWENKEAAALKEQVVSLEKCIEQQKQMIYDAEVNFQQLQKSCEEKDALNANLESKLLENKEAAFLKEQVVSLENLIEQQKQIIKDSDVNIQQLQKRCSTIITEQKEKQRLLDLERQQMIQNIQEFRDSMNQTLLQRDETLKRREDKIRELNLQIKILQQQKNSRLGLNEKENSLNA